MKTTKTLLAAPLALAFALAATPASAQLAPPVRAMLDAAIAGGNDAEIDTVAKLAKQQNPEGAAEVDTVVGEYRAAKEARRVEELRQASVLENWTGSAQVGGFRTTGNSSNTGFTVGIAGQRDGLNWRHKAQAVADFQKSNGVKTREQFLVGLQADYKINERIFAYGLGQWDRDRFQGIDSRWTASGGLGYRVIASDNLTLDVKAGPAWRRTSYTDGTSTSRINGLAGLDMAAKLSDNITLTENANAFFGKGNDSYTSLTALNASISDNLTAQVSYLWQRESQPPVGKKNVDTTTRFSLIYGF